MAVWAAGARVIYIRDLGLEWLCAAAGHAVDISVARGKWVFFFPCFRLWLGFGGVWQKSRFSGYWRFDWTVGGRELVFVNVYLPLSSRFFILYYYK